MCLITWLTYLLLNQLRRKQHPTRGVSPSLMSILFDQNTNEALKSLLYMLSQCGLADSLYFQMSGF